MKLSPRLLVADENGNIYDDPNLLMACSRGGRWFKPNEEELIPLPQESELFLLPGRRAVGYNPRLKRMEASKYLAVSVFAAPAYTLSAHPAYVAESGAPMLPLFAYGAVGYANGRFWICARRVDNDPRQIFRGIKRKVIEYNCSKLLQEHPHNRLINHIINNCCRKYVCPAARNFALGRYEAPLPTSRVCNARCIGCLSAKQKDSPLAVTPQCRLDFTPDSDEIVEVMSIHEKREKTAPIYSFGQGCEGEPILNASLLSNSIRKFRQLQLKGLGGHGTINCNSNASMKDAIAELAEAGLTSLRVSLNSARYEIYEAYYRPIDYTFYDVVKSICTARRLGVFVSLNLLYFPGITDTLEELDTLADLCANCGVSMIEWRNLNIDPHWYPEVLKNAGVEIPTKSIGLSNFLNSLKKKCPWLRYGYFNPWLGDKADITAPMPR